MSIFFSFSEILSLLSFLLCVCMCVVNPGYFPYCKHGAFTNQSFTPRGQAVGTTPKVCCDRSLQALCKHWLQPTNCLMKRIYFQSSTFLYLGAFSYHKKAQGFFWWIVIFSWPRSSEYFSHKYKFCFQLPLKTSFK